MMAIESITTTRRIRRATTSKKGQPANNATANGAVGILGCLLCFSCLALLILIPTAPGGVHGFAPRAAAHVHVHNNVAASSSSSSSSSRLCLFDKIFEEEGPLGKGITVGKIQIALQAPARTSQTTSSIFSSLEDHASCVDDSDANEDLARMANDVCLDLLRNERHWVAACASGEWFSSKDSGKAERRYNDLTNLEASKFEKEYVPDDEEEDDDDDDDDESTSTSSTLVVVSLVLEIQGDSTDFNAGAGYSVTKTKEVLASIASDCVVDDGYCVNAVEVFWTPSDRTEVMTKNDMIIDFPELIDL